MWSTPASAVGALLTLVMLIVVSSESARPLHEAVKRKTNVAPSAPTCGAIKEALSAFAPVSATVGPLSCTQANVSPRDGAPFSCTVTGFRLPFPETVTSPTLWLSGETSASGGKFLLSGFVWQLAAQEVEAATKPQPTDKAMTAWRMEWVTRDGVRMLFPVSSGSCLGGYRPSERGHKQRSRGTGLRPPRRRRSL